MGSTTGDDMKTIALAALLAVACSSDDPPPPYTWGDASLELATAFCQAFETCGGLSVDQPICTEHTRFHLCETNHTCETVLPEPEGPDAAMVCVADLLALTPRDEGCYFLHVWGYAPPGCEAIFALRP